MLLDDEELMRIRAGVTNALNGSGKNNPILLDMARLLNHIEAEARVPDIFGDVQQFLAKFGQTYVGPPRQLEGELLDFRLKHMREEVQEYADAVDANDKAGQLDALVDAVYVDLQTAAKQGFDFYAAWERVHVANMQKEAHPEGKGGIRKPPGWVAPDLSDLV